MNLNPATRENIARNLEEMAEFFLSAKKWLGTHHIEVYNPVVRAVSTFVRSVFIAAGGIVGGFMLARLFPDFPCARSTRKPSPRQINFFTDPNGYGNFNKD
jgi:hypothetical protein